MPMKAAKMGHKTSIQAKYDYMAIHHDAHYMGVNYSSPEQMHKRCIKYS